MQIDERKQLCAEVLKVDLEEKAAVREGECEEVFHLVPVAWLSQWILGERVTIKDKKDKMKNDSDDSDKGQWNLTTGVPGPPIDLTDSGVADGIGSIVPIVRGENIHSLSLSGEGEGPPDGGTRGRNGEDEETLDVNEGKSAVGRDEVQECPQIIEQRANLREEAETVIFEDSIEYPSEDDGLERTEIDYAVEVDVEENRMKEGLQNIEDIEIGRIGGTVDEDGRDEGSMTEIDEPEDDGEEIMSVDEVAVHIDTVEQVYTVGEPFALTGHFPDYCSLSLIVEDEYSNSSSVTFLDPYTQKGYKDTASTSVSTSFPTYVSTSASAPVSSSISASFPASTSTSVSTSSGAPVSMLGILDKDSVIGRGDRVNGVTDREGCHQQERHDKSMIAIYFTEEKSVGSGTTDVRDVLREENLIAIERESDVVMEKGGLDLDNVIEEVVPTESYTVESKEETKEDMVIKADDDHQDGTIVEIERDLNIMDNIDAQVLIEGDTEQSDKAEHSLKVTSDSPPAPTPAIFCDPITPYILPLLCPHYPQTLCGVHPNNVTAFKVVSDRAYRLIMASVQGGAVVGVGVGVGDGVGDGGLSGPRTQVAAVLSAGDSSSAQSHSSSSNTSRSSSSSSSSSNSGHSSIHIADSTRTHTHPHLNHHVDSSVPSPADLCTVIDITDKNYRCPLCFDQMIAKKDSLKVRAKEREKNTNKLHIFSLFSSIYAFTLLLILLYIYLFLLDRPAIAHNRIAKIRQVPTNLLNTPFLSLSLFLFPFFVQSDLTIYDHILSLIDQPQCPVDPATALVSRTWITTFKRHTEALRKQSSRKIGTTTGPAGVGGGVGASAAAGE
jgi:hypothetical protein